VNVGADPADPATRDADIHKTDYAAALGHASLKGARIGVLRFAAGFHPETDAVFETALTRLRVAGAILVDIKEGPGGKALDDAEQLVLLTEFKAGIEAYLAATPPARVKTRTLADLIIFDSAHAAQEMPYFGQELFEDAEKTKGLADPAYLKALADGRRIAGADGIDKMLKDNNVSALVAPTTGPAWLIDPILKDFSIGGAAGQLAAVAGYPHLTVPMGDVSGLPVGLSFIGPAWSEARLLGLGYAFEQTGRKLGSTAR
jgi:amidase